MEAIVLAGGLGTRLRSVVSDVPKPMAPVGGRPFLEFILRYWASQGVSRFVIAISHLASVIENHFGDTFEGIPVSYSVEEKPLGTGGGLYQAVEKLRSAENFLAVNGDTLYGVSLSELKKRNPGDDATMTLALRPVEKNDRYGSVACDESGRILSFASEATGATTLINGGVYLINPGAFRRARPEASKFSLESDLLPQLAENRALYGIVSQGEFLDIGVPEDYQRAPAFVQGLTEPRDLNPRPNSG